MQRAKDADRLAIYSDSTYPAGPDASGEITYIHVPPLNPLTSACKPFIDLNIPPDVCAPRSNHRSASPLSSRRILLVLHLSRGPKVLWRQGGRQGSHQTLGPGICAIAVRLTPADAINDATDARALRTAGHAHRAATAGSESPPWVIAVFLVLAFTPPVVFVFVLVPTSTH
ncbi:hypothetical protein BJV74DRAFT_78960 [Russula compacta]|nr:hypothetical protein BJV74DRAFT_78960 [Russula compacta]